MIKNAVLVGDQVPPDQYNAEDKQRGDPELVLRAHILGELLRNAQRWVKGYQSPESKAMQFGSLLDCVLLTPTQWPRRYAVLPEDAPRRPSDRQRNAKKQSDSSKESIAFWDRFIQHNPGEIISSELNAAAYGAANRIKEDPAIAELLLTASKQLMIVAEWHDLTGLVVPLKCLIDIVPSAEHPVYSNALFDLKTTSNASKRSFSKDAMKYRYDLQGAFYLDLFNAATNQKRSDFGHVIIESYHPYEFRTPPPLLTQRFLDRGRLDYQKALGIYCTGITKGVWSSYDQRSKQYPMTDCDDRFLSVDQVYDEMPEEEPEEQPEPAEELDVLP